VTPILDNIAVDDFEPFFFFKSFLFAFGITGI
jgi:hypothetical protein